jgi:PhzF family phenazine biosynthesis protein
MDQRRFRQVDVFTARPFAGNPVAVLVDAEGLDDASMQTIARWTNLSETTFVLPPTRLGADYRLRIFTPAGELPFAGHPTLGSAHAVREVAATSPTGTWLADLAGRDALVQECGRGLVSVTADPDERLWLEMPEAALTPLNAGWTRELASALGLEASELVDVPATTVDVGAVWVVASLASADALINLHPSMEALTELSIALGATGVTLFAPRSAGGSEGADAGYEVRSFAPAFGVPEDPVCGSGNGSVAHLLGSLGRTTDYEAHQGSAIGRDGRISVRFRDGAVEIGGHCVTVITGTLPA